MKSIFALLLVGVLVLSACDTNMAALEGVDEGQMATLASHGVPVTADSANWGFAQDGTQAVGTGAFVSGPGVAIIGLGSAEFSLADGSESLLLVGDIFDAPVDLADLTKLTYNTYHQSGSLQAVTIQFNVNTAGAEAWGGRLVFEPNVDGGSIVTGAWQTWDAMTYKGWWFTGLPGRLDCNQTTSCTLDQIKDLYPDALLAAPTGDPGLILFKAGSGWTNGFVGNVDGFTIGINGVDTTYDFGFAGKDVCKKGGWKAYGFKNQGQCIRYVNTGKDSR